MATIAIVVGHRKKSQGAVTCTGIPEWSWNFPLAHGVVEALERQLREAEVVLRPNFKSGNVTRLVKSLNSGLYLPVVELHFNSSGSREASGSEVLYYPGSQVGKALAESIQREVVACLGLPDRGCKATTHNYANPPAELKVLTRTRAPAVIVEPFFGSNPGDVARANLRKRQLAQAIADGITAVV